DKNTDEPIEEAEIKFTDSEGEEYVLLSTDEEGYYKTETHKYETYTIRASKEEYDTDEKVSKAKLDEQRIDFQLQRNVVVLTPGVDLANVLNIQIIYFDFDKSNIRPDAQVDLEKVYQVLKEYPEIRINIRSHTDSRGSDAYNLALSDRRAKSTKAYLINKGIDASRVEAEGLGERELINECSDGVPCTEAQHQANRRSEFIILGDNEHKIKVEHQAPEVIDEKKD
ncbi:MAG TPA: OmpA family protein, partial [Flavobacteriaceae bacterium]|nr:OmpA family protein [Flavobacteriaceae bacterium]